MIKSHVRESEAEGMTLLLLMQKTKGDFFVSSSREQTNFLVLFWERQINIYMSGLQGPCFIFIMTELKTQVLSTSLFFVCSVVMKTPDLHHHFILFHFYCSSGQSEPRWIFQKGSNGLSMNHQSSWELYPSETLLLGSLMRFGVISHPAHFMQISSVLLAGR